MFCFVGNTFLGFGVPKQMASLHSLTSTNAKFLHLCFKLAGQHDLLAQAELLSVCLWDTCWHPWSEVEKAFNHLQCLNERGLRHLAEV